MSLEFSEITLALVITTESDYYNARNLANHILKMELSKCISFCQIDSIYWWEGALEESQEVELTIKTDKRSLNRLLIALKNKHTYKLPQIICLNGSTSKEYKKWLTQAI